MSDFIKFYVGYSCKENEMRTRLLYWYWQYDIVHVGVKLLAMSISYFEDEDFLDKFHCFMKCSSEEEKKKTGLTLSYIFVDENLHEYLDKN